MKTTKINKTEKKMVKLIKPQPMKAKGRGNKYT